MNNINDINDEKIIKILESYKKIRDYQKQYCKDNLPDFRARNKVYYDKNKDTDEFKEKMRVKSKASYKKKKEREEIVKIFKFLPDII